MREEIHKRQSILGVTRKVLEAVIENSQRHLWLLNRSDSFRIFHTSVQPYFFAIVLHISRGHIDLEL